MTHNSTCSCKGIHVLVGTPLQMHTQRLFGSNQARAKLEARIEIQSQRARAADSGTGAPLRFSDRRLRSESSGSFPGAFTSSTTRRGPGDLGQLRSGDFGYEFATVRQMVRRASDPTVRLRPAGTCRTDGGADGGADGGEVDGGEVDGSEGGSVDARLSGRQGGRWEVLRGVDELLLAGSLTDRDDNQRREVVLARPPTERSAADLAGPVIHICIYAHAHTCVHSYMYRVCAYAATTGHSQSLGFSRSRSRSQRQYCCRLLTFGSRCSRASTTVVTCRRARATCGACPSTG